MSNESLLNTTSFCRYKATLDSLQNNIESLVILKLEIKVFFVILFQRGWPHMLPYEFMGHRGAPPYPFRMPPPHAMVSCADKLESRYC